MICVCFKVCLICRNCNSVIGIQPQSAELPYHKEVLRVGGWYSGRRPGTFGVESRMKEVIWTTYVGGRIILKWVLMNRNAGRGQYLRDSGQRQAVGCCDQRIDVRVLQTAGNF
jgi:hypothetical protein